MEIEVEQIVENWLPVPGFESMYEISNHGRVRRKAYKSRADHRGVSKQIAAKEMPVTRNNGYRVARLWREGKGIKLYIDQALESLFGISSDPDAALVLPGEEWRPIPGYIGYEASTLGRVRSRSRFINRKGAAVYSRGRLRRATIANHGYLKTELSLDGIIKTETIHRLVAMTFIPNPLNLEFVHHKDENKLNNRADNLEWVAPSTNVQDWFDRRRIPINLTMIETIMAAANEGKSAAEILAALPRKRKGK